VLSSRIALVLLSVVLAPLLRAEVDVPLRNWTIPPYRSVTSDGGLAPMTDISNGIGFVAVTPCRIADTRGLGFSGQAGPPVLNTGTRTFQITGTVTGVPAQCGIPSGADAVSFQFTIVSPNTNGNLIAWPAGGAVPTISVLNWSAGETALGNGTIVPVSASGALSVRINAAVGSATGHLVIDVNGYFTDTYPDNVTFEATSTTAGTAILARNTSTAANATAIRAIITSLTPGAFATAIQGVNNGNGYGIYGASTSGYGVVATTGGAVPNAAVYATNGSTGAGSSAVYGSATGNARTYGVFGETSGDSDSAGVRGVGDTDGGSGVRGEGRTGVLGVGSQQGVSGFAPSFLVGGHLGVTDGMTTYGVFADGDYGGSGAKYFVEPHPADASKVIRYAALEGPEAGTYFRGRGRFERGVARIPVPEDFRLVTDPDGLTVQVTPIGRMASVGVVRADLNEIVVESSRNLEFYYLVQGVRKTHKHLVPIKDGREYMPKSPDTTIPLYLTDGQKQMLVDNGTYNADGTVNMETARRLGWDKEWEKGARPVPQPAE
jgi:hypothetical protein